DGRLDLIVTDALDPGEPTSLTGPQGYYAFAGLTAGTYQVRWIDEAGRRPTTPDGGVREVTLSDAGQLLTGLDFGNAVSIDHVWTIPASGTGDWTVRLNRGRLEVLDRDLGVVDSQPLDDLHSLTITGADGRASRLTLDLAAGFFALPGGVTFQG